MGQLPDPPAGFGDIRSASLIQTNAGNPGNFHVVVRVADHHLRIGSPPAGGWPSNDKLLLYWTDGGQWHGPTLITVGDLPISGITGN